jgi:arylsulfatase
MLRLMPLTSCLLLGLFGLHAAEVRAAERPPNIVFILADDLGIGDIGPYGQKKIRTPNIDRLAAEGMKFTNHYSGSNVCAPSRCSLMTGLHTGHTYIRENRGGLSDGKGKEGQEPVPANYLVLPLGLKKLGYATGGFGKWGLGFIGATGDPLAQGFDHFYGYNCQGVAHNYYPDHLWDDAKRVELKNPTFSAHQKLPADADPKNPASYERYRGTEYAPDLIAAKAREFLRANKDKPFFLYFPTTVPHLALQVPEDSLKEYEGKFPDDPYVGDRDYLPVFKPHATYAAMVTRMDREVGRLMDLVKELGLEDNTVFIFTSDNGALFDTYGGTDSDFFNSNAGFRGRKGSNFEGGLRAPLIVRWKGHIAAGTTTDRICGFEDCLPTLLEIIGAKDAFRGKIDGVSFAPVLFGKTADPKPFIYRESPGGDGQQSVREGKWKAIRLNLNPRPRVKDKTPGTVQLFDLEKDPAETKDVAPENPDVVKHLAEILQREHTPSKLFPLKAIDPPAP